MSVPDESWENEPPDNGRLDFGFAVGHLTLNVSGGQVMVVIGSEHIAVTQEQRIREGDWITLEQSLHQYGFDSDDVAQLKAALVEDDQRIGNATHGWLGRISEKVADGALSGVAVDVIVTLIRGFLGI